jgi:hypothetical protein
LVEELVARVPGKDRQCPRQNYRYIILVAENAI